MQLSLGATNACRSASQKSACLEPGSSSAATWLSTCRGTASASAPSALPTS